MDPDEEKIMMLLGMGFPDVQAIKKALRLSNGDMNDAVTYLTEKPISSFSSLDDLRDIFMSEAGTSASTEQASQSETANPLEFPASCLYELESRVFTESWMIPYKREESLGQCLMAATRLAQEGLCETDKSCQMFLERCLPECFQKLLNSGVVRRWVPDIQEGVFSMLDLLIDLVIARLQKGSLPEDLLRNTLSLAFDFETEWNQKNKHRSSEYVDDIIYANCSSNFETYGWLIDIINMFGNKGGFELLSQRFEEEKEMDSGQMTALLLPVANCSKYLVKDIISPLFSRCIKKAIEYISNLEEKQLKGKRIRFCYQLLEAIRQMCTHLWPNEANDITSLHLNTIIKMLKTPHFSARMIALKELGILINNSEKHNSSGMDCDFIQDWMTEKRVLSLALEGNLDQVQYTDRMKELVEFMGPKLQEEELTRIWGLCEKASAHVLDNIHRVMVAAASRFNPHQFEHLLKLIRKSWENGNDRLREKLLSLIGRIGQDSRLGRTSEKMLDTLWELARVQTLPPHLVHLAIEEHLLILNKSAMRDQLRKSYIIRCIEDINENVAIYLPLKQLHHLAKSFFKTDKANLFKLNHSHEIVKLVTESLGKCHALAIEASGGEPPHSDTLIDGKYSHNQYMYAHLDFLHFLLKEGDIYLAWPRCKEIWDTLITNPNSSSWDKEICLVWFSQCLNDLESSTQQSLFNERLFQLDPSTLTRSAFNCFVEYFYVINIHEHTLVRSGDKCFVDSLDLIGMDFIWQIVLECSDDQLAEEVIRFLLDISYHLLSVKMKKDPAHLHQRFISLCYKKLERSLLHVKQSIVGSALTSATKTLTAVSVSEIASLSPSSKRSCLQHIHRVLILVERYISTVEEQYSGPRSLLPHAACFLGKPLTVVAADESNKNHVILQCHSNESMGSLRSKIAKGFCIQLEQLQQIAIEKDSSDVGGWEDSKYQSVINGAEFDNRLLHQLDILAGCKLTVKVNPNVGVQLKEVGDTWNELPDVACYTDFREDGASANAASNPQMTSSTDSGSIPSGAMSPTSSDTRLEQEKRLPGVVLANIGKDMFNMLYQLALLEDYKIFCAVCKVLYLVPTDPLVADKMDTICTGSKGVASSVEFSKKSPVNSPAKKEKITNKAKRKEASANILISFLKFNMEVTPFRLLYNLEVLSSKVMPLGVEGNMQNNSKFCEEFLSCGGLMILTNLLHKDALPQEMNYELRQSIYFIVLQLLSYLLCGPEWSFETPISSFDNPPCPPKKTALDASIRNSKESGNVRNPSSTLMALNILQSISCEEWLDTLNNIMKVAWASAAGKLQLCSSGLGLLDQQVSSPESFKSSRENSTGSGHSSGSESEKTFQGGICMQQTLLNHTDKLICMQAVPLLITVLSLRPNLFDKWYSLPSVKEFIIELIIGCTSGDVREKACEQFIRLTRIQTVISPQPSQFLTQILLKARLPLWVSSTSARGATLKVILQSFQYFDLTARVLSNLSANIQETLDINANQMLEDEINWLINFTTTREATRERPESEIGSLRNAENILIAGHLAIISALLSCEGVDHEKIGINLIKLLLSEYLFPASSLILESKPVTDLYEASHMCSAKCTGKASRLSAYNLLVQLSLASADNYNFLSQQLIMLHHSLDKDFLKEFEHCPVVDGRCSSGYVGLKNGGATCYMNSVLQQLFLVPGIQEDILAINSDGESDESLFFQLQSLFGHLLESQLQYYTPEKFWNCFSMGGQPVNIREQQDAFEFYTRLTEEVDDFLKDKSIDSIFARRFEGVYSIQRICQDCPHRYEREEPFLALNLTVTKCNDLLDSLEQFIKGELLEGDNAYFCDKCNQKRTALIRTFIKSLPSVLVIQLKRFGYDWEASRALKFDDYFKFPFVLDMGAYTATGLAEQEDFFTPERDKNKDTLASDSQQTSGFSPRAKTSKGSPLRITMPTTPNFSTPRKASKIRYELVGVIVHSGQANAGHYYSYIKDRRGNAISNPNKGKWFKFNDTTVEYVEMSDGFIEQEWFGGTYKAKVSYDSSNPLPEDRLRYWNGYLLFYECLDDVICTPRTPKTPRLGRTSRSLRASVGSARKNLSLGGFDVGKTSSATIDPLSSSPKETINIKLPRTSLCELSELLQQGEKKGMFRQIMPPRILATITHDNLIFLRNRDLYSEYYYNFIYNICSVVLQDNSQKSIQTFVDSASLSMHFLLNTYFRTKSRDASTISKWMELLISLLENEPAVCKWTLNYFTLLDGESHIIPLLLENQDKLIRVHFGNLLGQVLKAECKHTGNVESVEKLIKNLLSFLSSEVPAAVKTSQQYFILLQEYCSQGNLQCNQVLQLGGMSQLTEFLLSPTSTKRRWSSVQSQDFGPLHNTMATLILVCDIPYLSKTKESSLKSEASDDDQSNNTSTTFKMPSIVRDLLYGSLRDQWLKEVTLAYREVVGGIPQMTEALKVISTDNSSFSFALLTVIMSQYGVVASNMLKDLSHLLLELLSLNDSLHEERISAALSGFTGYNDTHVPGLLGLIDSNKEIDSRRAYQCIKLIVALSSRSAVAREELTNTQSRWQWAVEWLKEKMEDHSSTSNTTVATDLGCFSNEDSNTKNFQRTTSAQWTLEEATALLSGMDHIGMEIDCEQQELTEIKESASETESTPSNESCMNESL